MHAGLCLGGRNDTLATRGTLMDKFYNKNFKNNSTSSQGSRRFYSDSHRSHTHHQSWESKGRHVNDRYSQQLSDPWLCSADSFQINSRESQLIGRQTKTCQSAQKKADEYMCSSGTSEESNKQNLLNNFIPWGSSATCDLTFVKDYESIQSSFSSFRSPIASGSKENPDYSRREQPSDDLLQRNPFSESSTMPFEKSEDKTLISCSRTGFSTTVPSCSRTVYSTTVPSCSRTGYSTAVPSCSRTGYSNTVPSCSTRNEANEKVELLVDERIDFPTFRFMNIRKRLGICAADHPLVTLSFNQLQAIKADILEKIFEPEGQQIRPRFFGVGIQKGYLVLVCGDDITVSWVKELPKSLKVPGGGRLKVVEEPYDNKTFIAVGYFPKSDKDSNARILKFLEIQNEGLDVSKWKILNKDYEKNQAVRLTFSIDWMSAKKLKARGPLLNYKFGGARFLLKTKRGVKFKQEESCGDIDLDYESFEDFPLTPTQFPNPLAYPEVKRFKFEKFSKQLSEDQIPPSYPKGVSDYQAKVAKVVEKSKNTLRLGLTSKERFLMHKKIKRKKRKKNQIKVEPH